MRCPFEHHPFILLHDSLASKHFFGGNAIQHLS
jgi:hypothetical protein